MTSNLILRREPTVGRMAPNRGPLQQQQQQRSADLDSMRYEKNRLATFAGWPLDAPVPRERLAKAGFFFKAAPYRVQCFSCGGTVDDWQFNEQAMLKHRLLFPSCAFVTHQSDNVPLLDGSSPTPPRDSGYSSSQSPPSSQGSSTASTSPRSGFRFPLAGAGGAAGARGPTAGPRTWDSFALLKSERHRRRTFDAWPLDFVRPDELARAGFFYLNDADKAQCIFCRGIVGDWEVGDVPMTEHSRHFPQCPLVRGVECGNVPADGSDSESDADLEEALLSSTAGGVDEVGHRIDFRTRSVAETAPCSGLTSSHLNVKTPQGSEQSSDLAELGIAEHHAPIHPSYATVESRLRTYQYWPPALAQKPIQLAEAGFFYAGVSDHVKCFHCDGGLRNWVPGDEPWTEHARWFSRCGFLRLVKGDDFIQDVLRQHPMELPPQQQQQQQRQQETSVKRTPISDQQLEDMMEDAICKTAVELGVARDAVKRVLKQRLESTGVPFTDLSSVLAMAMEHTQATYQPPHSSESGPGPSHARLGSTLSAASSGGDSGVGDAQDEQMDVQTDPEETSEQRSDAPREMTTQSSTESTRTLTGSGGDSGPETPKVLSPVSGQASSATTPCSSSSLEEEYNRLKEQKQCKVCMDGDVGVVFLPCGHLITCVNCAPALRDCPLCRQPIRGTVRTYLS